MKVSCDIIRDLLPLYAEDMVSQASREMVDEHLCGCEECVKELGRLKKAEKVPAEIETQALKRLGKAIRRRRLLTAAAAVMTVLAPAVTGIIFMMTPFHLTAEEAVEGVELREDGGLAIDWASGIVGHSGIANSGRVPSEVHSQIHLCYTTRYDWLQGRQVDKQVERMTQEELEAYIMKEYGLKEMTQKAWDRFNNIFVDYGTWETNDGRYIPYDPDTCLEGEGTWVYKTSEDTHWYANFHNGSADTLLWGDEDAKPISWYKDQHHTHYSYAILLFGTLILAVVSGMLAWRKKGLAREILARLTILGAGIAFATLLVTGGEIITYAVMMEAVNYEWPGYIATESAFVVATALIWYQLYTLNRQDKAI